MEKLLVLRLLIMACLILIGAPEWCFSQARQVGVRGGETPNFEALQSQYEPTQADLKAFVNHASQRLGRLTKPQGPGCSKAYSAGENGQVQESYVCLATPEPEKQKWALADLQEIECGINQRNDGAVWNLRKEGKSNEKLSDDVGYTLGLRAKCKGSTPQSVVTVELESDLFTRKVSGSNGFYKRDPEGRFFLETFEQVRLSAEFEDKSKGRNLRPVGKVGVLYETEKSDGIGSQIQNVWHDQLDRYQNLRYNSTNRGRSEISAQLQAGFKAFVETDISKFQCSASSKFLVGFDTQGRPLVTSHLEGQVSTGAFGGRDRDTPLFLLYLAQRNELRGTEHSRTTEMEAGSYVWKGQSTAVYFGIGRVIHRSPAYTAYTPREEPITTVHIRVKKEF